MLGSASKVFAGNYHSFVLLKNNTVYAFGDNTNGKLGLGDIVNRFIPNLVQNLTNVQQISSNYYHTLALTTNRTVFSFGNNQVSKISLII